MALRMKLAPKATLETTGMPGMASGNARQVPAEGSGRVETRDNALLDPAEVRFEHAGPIRSMTVHSVAPMRLADESARKLAPSARQQNARDAPGLRAAARFVEVGRRLGYVRLRIERLTGGWAQTMLRPTIPSRPAPAVTFGAL